MLRPPLGIRKSTTRIRAASAITRVATAALPEETFRTCFSTEKGQRDRDAAAIALDKR